MRKIILIISIIACMLVFTGCFEQTPVSVSTEVEPVVKVDSGDEEVVEVDNNTYGNGSDIVKYNGSTYYIEYNSSDFSNIGLYGNYYKNEDTANSQRYINVIHANGSIDNLFKVTGVEKFYIVDDRFYFQAGNGMLHATDMKGEDDLELLKGSFVAIDEANHAVYYVSSSAESDLYKVDTKTLKISTVAYANEYHQNGYNYLGVNGDNIYYYKVDEDTLDVYFVKHVISTNENIVISKTTLTSDFDVETTLTNGWFYSDVSMLEDKYYVTFGFKAGTANVLQNAWIYEFNLKDEKAKQIVDNSDSESLCIYNNGVYYEEIGDSSNRTRMYSPSTGLVSVIKDDAIEKFENDSVIVNRLGSVELTTTFLDKIAKENSIDLEAEYSGDDASDANNGSKINLVSVTNGKVVGDTLFFTMNIGKIDPVEAVGWRVYYLRKSSSIYAFDFSTKKLSFVYSYNNNEYKKILDEAIAKLQKSKDNANIVESGETSISGESTEAQLRDDEMLLTISVKNVWKKQFNVKVTEVGGGIIGTRIEYEGTHNKEDGDIVIKVNKEVGAMLKVYVDGEEHSQMIISKDN